MNRWIAALLLVAGLGAFAFFCVTIIDEREQAFRTLLNQAEPKVLGVSLNQPNLTEPGWYVVIPGLHELTRYDRRNIHFHSAKRSLNTVERTLVDVDYYIVWRIVDPRAFYESYRREDAAVQRIDEVTYSEVRETVNKHSLADLLSPTRGAVQQEITASADGKLRERGVRIVDVRLGATLYPEENLARVYDRMRTERARFALKFRAEGEQQARALRSKADGESQVILATAERESLELRGTGDAEAARIYSEAYSGDPEFYAFFRSLEAYRKSLDAQTTVVMSPRSGFLKYLFDMNGTPPVSARPER
ncbi:MAG TPA: protease modulator HflC [Myxococcota bacterium]|nr:protease modulator HflC [Myxococcota bacterium]